MTTAIMMITMTTAIMMITMTTAIIMITMTIGITISAIRPAARPVAAVWADLHPS